MREILVDITGILHKRDVHTYHVKVYTYNDVIDIYVLVGLS